MSIKNVLQITLATVLVSVLALAIVSLGFNLDNLEQADKARQHKEKIEVLKLKLEIEKLRSNKC